MGAILASPMERRVKTEGFFCFTMEVKEEMYCSSESSIESLKVVEFMVAKPQMRWVKRVDLIFWIGDSLTVSQ